MTPPSPAIFVSSTARDLAEYREAVCETIHRDGRYRCVCMEYFGARDAVPAEFCRERLAESTLFVGIIGHLYGSPPPDSEISFTEMEYRTAIELEKPCLIFMAPDDFPLPVRLREPDDLFARQRAFRNAVRQKRICDEFSSSDDLSRRVLQAVRDWEQGQEAEPPPPPATPRGFEKQVGDWLEKLDYRFERRGAWSEGWFRWIVSEPPLRGSDRILVSCGEREARLQDIEALDRAARDAGVAQAWLVVPRRIAPAARDAAERSDRPRLFCWTFDELLDRQADFGKYFDWLEAEVERLGIERYYVPLACTQDELDPATAELKVRHRYSREHGGLEHYVDLWLDDPAKEHISILGGFGTGKTWFALHYAHKLLRQYRDAQKVGLERPRLPLYVPLRDYAKAVSIESLFSEFFFKKHEIPIPGYSVFEHLNRAGRLLLIFDGFDEMAARVDHQSMVNNFWELARVVVPGSKAILTCRTEHFPDAVQGRHLLRGELRDATAHMVVVAPRFEVVELELFDRDQIREVLRRHGTGEADVDKILANEDLADLVRRPLLVDFVLEALPEIAATTPVDTAHVFAVAVRRKMERDIRQEKTFTSMADKLYFMCEISWEMIRDDQLWLHYKDFPERLRRLFGPEVSRQRDLDHWAADMRNQTLLVRQAGGEYSPAHRSLCEFFAAYKLVAELGVLAPEFLDLVSLRKDQIDPEAPPREYTWTEYFTREREADGRYRPIAALRGFTPEKDVDPDGQRSTVRMRLLPSNAQIFAAGMVARDAAAIDRLSTIALSATGFFSWNALLLFPLLREELGSELARKITEASAGKPLRPGWPWVLGELGEAGEGVSEALERTVEAVARGEDIDPISWWHSAFALRKLGRLGTDPERDEASPIDYLARHRPPGCNLEDARRRISEALRATDLSQARISELDVVTIAAERDRIDAGKLYRELFSQADFAGDPRGERRCYYVVWLCGSLEIKESVGNLIQAARHPNSSVRGCTAEALGKIGEASPEVIRTLVKLLGDPYYRARFHAAVSLESLAAIAAIDDLALAIRREDVRGVRDRMKVAWQRLEECRSS